MAFNNLTKEVKPVNNVQIYNCSEFTGKFSSITGIASRFIYITRIDQLTGSSLEPNVRIVCGVECKNKCVNLPKPINYIT